MPRRFRVAVLGNCQADGLASCLRVLNPEMAAVAFSLTGRDPAGMKAVASKLSGFDLVLSQELAGPVYGPLRTERIKAAFKQLVIYPHVAFTGFHPDMCFIKANGRWVGSPMGNYHSRIVAGAYAAAVPVAHVADLFNAYIYALLGYFDEYHRARELLASRAASIGVGIAERMDAWQADGAFMHSSNHPKIRVIADISLAVALKSGLVSADTAAPIGVPDRLANGARWPVYPEVARRLGLSGGLVFTAACKRVLGRVSARELSLEEFVRQSYRTYRQLPAEVMRQPRMARTARLLRAA